MKLSERLVDRLTQILDRKSELDPRRETIKNGKKEE